jgi:WXXGXW repeat (2 copies)
MREKRFVKPAVVLVSALMLGGCVVHETRYRAVPVETEVVVAGPPPAPPAVVEVRPAPPAVDFVWVPGFWAWEARGWHWRAGTWVRPPHPGLVWYNPHYVYRGGRHVWVTGGWR